MKALYAALIALERALVARVDLDDDETRELAVIRGEMRSLRLRLFRFLNAHEKGKL